MGAPLKVEQHGLARGGLFSHFLKDYMRNKETVSPLEWGGWIIRPTDAKHADK